MKDQSLAVKVVQERELERRTILGLEMECWAGKWLDWEIIYSTNIANAYFVPDSMQSIGLQR